MVLRTYRNNFDNVQQSLEITRVDRDDALIEVVERQLVAFHTEAKNDDEPFPTDARDAAELRMALRTAREERVGDEEVFEL